MTFVAIEGLGRCWAWSLPQFVGFKRRFNQELQLGSYFLSFLIFLLQVSGQIVQLRRFQPAT